MIWFGFVSPFMIYEIVSFNQKDFKLMKDIEGNIGLGRVKVDDIFESQFTLRDVSPGQTLIKAGDKSLVSSHEILSVVEDTEQFWTISLSGRGAFRISKEGYCITVVSEVEVAMTKCTNKDSELFLLVDVTLGSVLKPYGGPIFSFQREMRN